MIPATDNLHSTRRQLDDLEALVKKMLDLAGGEDAPSREEDLASQGIFSEDAFLGLPKEKSSDPSLPSKGQPEGFLSYRFQEPNLNTGTRANEEVNSQQVDKPNPQADTPWKPSTLTWAPLAESWEKAKLPAVSNQNVELEINSSTKEKKADTASFFQQGIQTKGTTSNNSQSEISPIPGTAASNYPPLVKKKRRSFWRNMVGFLGIVLIVFAIVLVIMSY